MTGSTPEPTSVDPGKPGGYTLRISPTTVDKLGVKLYDKVSAVVAELLANAYDADAETVLVNLPLGTHLAVRDKETKLPVEATPPWTIEVIDDGHGMTPGEARRFFLEVGRDRRLDPLAGAKSRKKKRAVMGRKGIGKLAPFGVCRLIEVQSSGGDETDQGYYTTHFILDYDTIMATPSPDGGDDKSKPAVDRGVPLVAGASDGMFLPTHGTTIRLSSFDAKAVPDLTTFRRQLERRFALARDDFSVTVHDTRGNQADFELGVFDVPIASGTEIDLSTRPVQLDDGTSLPVAGKLGMATEAYRNEEMAGVRIYARGKIIATTRDFEQPAGFTGEFTIRSYLVGEVHADWLDLDDGDDLVRTDRQDILWSSDLGSALQKWGAELIKEVGTKSRGPRRDRVENLFMKKADVERRVRERFSDAQVVTAAIDLAKQVGRFAAEDELEDQVYLDGLLEVVMSVAPHRALMTSFQQLSVAVDGPETLEGLADLFGQARIAEVASYGQIAYERVRAITELEEALSTSPAPGEEVLQKILANAPYLIEPTWVAITMNQQLKTFKTQFEHFYKTKYGDEVSLAIEWENKRPDFVMAGISGLLHLVEIKKPQHVFTDADFERLFRYVEALRTFAAAHKELLAHFRGWRIVLVADEVKIKSAISQQAYSALEVSTEVQQISWVDFLVRAKTAHQRFLDARDEAAKLAAAAAS